MIKNQPDSRLRRTTLFVNMDDGATPIARNTTFAGRLFIDKGDANYVLAGGILTNKRRPFTGANFAFTADPATDKLHKVTHALEVLDGPFQATTTGTLPLNMELATDYWVTPFGDDDWKISESLDDALAGNYIDIGDAGTGVHTWNFQAGTQRGIDGDFQYEFSQAETDQTALFLTVFIPYLEGTNATARAIVSLESDVIGFDAVSESGYSYGDQIRAITAICLGAAQDFATGVIQWMAMDGVTPRIQGTTTPNSRGAIVILNLNP